MPTSNRNSEPRQPVPGAVDERAVSTDGSKTGNASSSAAIFSADLQGDFTGCNSAFTQLFGYSPQELLGRNFAALFAPAERADGEDQTRLRRTILTSAAQSDYHAPLLAYNKAGSIFSVQFSATLLRDAASAPTAVVAVVVPVSQPVAQAAATKADAPVAVVPVPGIVCRKFDDTQFILASPVMHKFMGLVDRVAGHTETVLVTGETGTGKELVARTIHESSYRYKQALVDINCAALPEHLVESELFGYEKGAFSGADSSKPGLFELADKSTIFLDEIGELQPQIQVKLLRVLDGQPYYRLGGNRKITVDVRVVAATNQDLELAVKEGRFRKDLFHRLGQFQLRVPPLRERSEDIAALARHFLSLKSTDKAFTVDAIVALQAYLWPG